MTSRVSYTVHVPITNPDDTAVLADALEQGTRELCDAWPELDGAYPSGTHVNSVDGKHELIVWWELP